MQYKGDLHQNVSPRRVTNKKNETVKECQDVPKQLLTIKQGVALFVFCLRVLYVGILLFEEEIFLSLAYLLTYSIFLAVMITLTFKTI